ncbi:MAG: hypothetical protein ACKO2F_00740 [Cyanobacteriota bacterium]
MALIARDDPRPWLLVDHLGEVLAINACFTEVYGWCETDLLGQHMVGSCPIRSATATMSASPASASTASHGCSIIR